MQINEVPLNFSMKELPHGNLDVLVVTPSTDSTCTQIGVVIVDGDVDKELSTGPMKTEASLSEHASGKYVYSYVGDNKSMHFSM